MPISVRAPPAHEPPYAAAPSRCTSSRIGNALVDVLSHAPTRRSSTPTSSTRGAMVMVDLERAEAVYARSPAGAGDLGRLRGQHRRRARVVRRQRRVHRPGARRPARQGLHPRPAVAWACSSTSPAATAGPATGRCLVVVTPDAAAHAVNTYLGASSELGPDDVDPELIAAAQVTYLEGYLWDQPAAKEAIRKAAATRPHDRPATVALTLSDPFCVDRHRDEFLRPRRERRRHRCSPTTTRSAPSTRSTSSTRPSTTSAGTARSPR